MVQKGHGQLVDVLLIGWWLINPWFQLYWGLCAYGQHTTNFSHRQEFQYLQNNSKILFYMSFDGEPQPCSKAILLPLNYFSLVSASPPFPNQQLLELREGHGGWMKPIFCNQETGDTERLLCSGTSQGPAQYHSLPPSPWDSILKVEVGWGRNILPNQRCSDNITDKSWLHVGFVSFPLTFAAHCFCSVYSYVVVV